MRAWGSFLWCLSSLTAVAAPTNPDFDFNCAELFENVHISLIAPTEETRHAPLLEKMRAQILEDIRSRVVHINRVLIEHPDDSEFSSSIFPSKRFEGFFPQNSYSRRQLISIGEALLLTRKLIFFQAEIVGAYNNWTGEILPLVRKTYSQMLLELDPTYKRLSASEIDKVFAPYKRKSLKEWKNRGAIEALRTAAREFEEDPTVPHHSFGNAEQVALDEDLHEMEEHHLAPNFFLPYLHQHVSLTDFYGVPRTELYYQIIQRLEAGFAPSLHSH